MNFVWPFLRTYYKSVGVVLLLVLVITGAWAFFDNDVEILQLPSPPNSTAFQVDARELTPRIIEQIVKDPAQQAEIERLLAENKRLKTQVTQLNVTVAKLQSQGGGTIATVPRDTVPEPLRPAATSTGVTDADTSLYEFKDWRLHFVTDGASAKYELNQKFEVLSTTGRTKDGKPLSITTVAEIGAQGERLPLETQTLNIFADETKSHWMFGHLNLQGGGVVTVETPKKIGKGFAVSSQWLRKGRTAAAEDSSVAILSPVAFVSDTVKELGVFPVSVNLGQIPRTPFNDMWLSPYVGVFSGVKPTRSTLNFGIGVTTTF
jgi:hypothetical protein